MISLCEVSTWGRVFRQVSCGIDCHTTAGTGSGEKGEHLPNTFLSIPSSSPPASIPHQEHPWKQGYYSVVGAGIHIPFSPQPLVPTPDMEIVREKKGKWIYLLEN